MLHPTTTPLAVSLADGLTLRSLRSPDDLPRLAALMGEVFGLEVGRWVNRMYPVYPGLEPADMFFVEDANGAAVSTLTLIPWTLQYGAAKLPAGELGIVCTAEAYRRRGLVAAQMKYFKQRLAERGCLLSLIQGIPFYYRQYGYDYAWPLEGGWRLELRQAPATPDAAYTVRDATPADIPALIRLYAEAAAPLTIKALRTDEIWRYMLTPAPERDADTHRAWVVCDGAGDVVAYLRLPDYHFGTELVVDEASRCMLGAARSLFAALRAAAEADGQPFIRLRLPNDHDLAKLARAWGGVDEGTYAWQVHVPDLAALLRTLIPTLNQRLADSVYARYTAEVTLSLYRDGLTLRFVEGRLVEVGDLHPVDKSDAQLPPATVMPLIMGHRSLPELRRIFPDIHARGEIGLLLEILFPPATAFLYQVY